MIFKQKFICDECGEFEFNVQFSEKHKRKYAVIFTKCPVCDKAISAEGPNEEVGELIDIEPTI